MGADDRRELWIACEGGGTKTRVLLGTPSGEVLARETGGTASSLYVRGPAFARSTRPMVGRLRKAAGRAGGVVTVVGLAAPMNVEAAEALFREVFGGVELVRAGEGDLALAQYGLRCGVSLVAGTGACCRCLDERGRQVTVGGFGPQFGDEGSGYWIGREGIAAVFREGDGRGEVTALTARARAHFGIDNIWEILRRADACGHVPGPVVASLAGAVAEAARAGDGVSRRILSRAGAHLGRLVLGSAGQSRLRARPIPVVPTGGVFGAGHLVLTPLKRILSRSGTAFEVMPPVLEPAQGLFNIIAMRRSGR